jgi:hypothetical protein
MRSGRILLLSVLSVAFAFIVSISACLHLDVAVLIIGANINHALVLVMLGSVLALAVMLAVRKRPRRLAVVLCSEAAVLSTGIVLVALDSTRYAGIARNVLGKRYKFDDHVWYLYLLWGAPLFFSCKHGVHGLLARTHGKSNARSQRGRSTTGAKRERDFGASTDAADNELNAPA